MQRSDQLSSRFEENTDNQDFRICSLRWAELASRQRYVHKLTWLGRPILQVPQDIYAVQELVWNVRPDLIVETGIAHGGSLILSASMLALVNYCDANGGGAASE
jgi:cephalosporin hydroxylase